MYFGDIAEPILDPHSDWLKFGQLELRRAAATRTLTKTRFDKPKGLSTIIIWKIFISEIK